MDPVVMYHINLYKAKVIIITDVFDAFTIMPDVCLQGT